MSFDKDYPNRKDQRKPYRGSKRFAGSCRNHGSCSWCQGNRTIQAKRHLQVHKEELEAGESYRNTLNSLFDD